MVSGIWIRYALDLAKLPKMRLSEATTNTTPANSLERAMVILERIARRPGGLTNKQLSEELGIATSTCSYILSRLEGQGYLARNSTTARYEIGLKVLAIARGVLRQVDFGKVADPVLHRLSGETGLDAIVGVLDQERLLVVNRVSSSDFAGADVDTGTEFPATATAAGKVLLAHLPPEEVIALMDGKYLEKYTYSTIVSRDELLSELGVVMKQGYAVSDEEFRLGMRALAVPIVDSGRSVRAALAVAGSTKQAAWRELTAVVATAKSAAREISRLMNNTAADRHRRK